MNRDNLSFFASIVQALVGIYCAVLATVALTASDNQKPLTGLSGRLKYGLLFLGGAILLSGAVAWWRRIKPIVFIRKYVEPFDPSLGFSPKVRVEFRNRSGRCLDIQTSRWVAGKNGLPERTNQPNATWQIYRNDQWAPSPYGESRIHVQNAEKFRTWLSFAANFSEADLQTRMQSGTLGTLEILYGGRTKKFRL
jgi:hypothetical protein